MAYKNNHYVPQFILRRYSEQLCTFNVKTKDYQTNQNTSSIFSNHEFYPVEIEKDFNRLIESPFASILNSKILKCKARSEIELTRKEVNIIKKFLLLEQFRVFNINTELCQDPKISALICPFKEKIIDGETTQDRWLRNIRVILECKDLSHIQEHPLCTSEAYRWAQIYVCGYIAFWDSSFDGTEFIISDIGMTSELEESYFTHGLEIEKKNYLAEQIKKYSQLNPAASIAYAGILQNQQNFHENFYMFSISKNRMIVIINPFFRLYTKREKFPEPDIWPSQIKDKGLFEKNISPKLPVIYGKPVFKDTDLFRYKVHSMKHEDIILVNMLMLDRIDTFLGFTSEKNIHESVNAYMEWYKQRNIPPRNDYSSLLNYS